MVKCLTKDCKGEAEQTFCKKCLRELHIKDRLNILFDYERNINKISKEPGKR